MISKDLYLESILDNTPRLLGLLNRNISSSSYGCFDREFWHYNTSDIPCARKQEAVLTLTLLYLIKHEKNRYYQSREILEYIRAALMFWKKIQNNNGSFNEWYPNEHSFVATSFSTYAISESMLLLKRELPEKVYSHILGSLKKAGDWLVKRNETRVMNQQTGAVIALYNLYLLTNDAKYLNASKEKISVLNQRQSAEGWFIEYGGPDIGYLSLAIDYLCKYYKKTNDTIVKEIVSRSLGFIKYFIQPSLVAGGEFTSRNTEYLIPHGFEVFSSNNEDALFIAAAVRKSLLKTDSFPNLFDDRYLTYVGYTWLQAYMDANPELNGKTDVTINRYFDKSFEKFFEESGLVIINDENKHLVVNMKKGGSFRLFDKRSRRTYSDSGILVESRDRWYTSGWLSTAGQYTITDSEITVQGSMWQVPDKTLTPWSNILLRLFQMTFGRSSFISLWIKERLRDLLITKTKPSSMSYNRSMFFKRVSGELLKIRDSVRAQQSSISSFSVFSKDTHIYVPSSRYYVDVKEPGFQKEYSDPVSNVEVEWIITSESKIDFKVNM